MKESSAPLSTVLNDSPEQTADLLGYKPYADTLANLIASPSTQSPLTIGIFGSWGSGKSSLMNMIRGSLDADKPYVLDAPEADSLVINTARVTHMTHTIWFNAWLYSKEETLWRALIAQVIAGIRSMPLPPDYDDPYERQLKRERLDEMSVQLYRVVSEAELGSFSISGGSLVGRRGAGAARLTLTLQQGLDLLEKIAAVQAEEGGEMDVAARLQAHVRDATTLLEQARVESLVRFQAQFKELVDEYVLPYGYLVVFVDDLDRCLPEKAVEVLEAMKLFLDVPGCIFVLGIDQDVIERGIQLRYREMGRIGDSELLPFLMKIGEADNNSAEFRQLVKSLGGSNEQLIDGGRYLEKIIQIPFVLPPISQQSMTKFIVGAARNLPQPQCARVFAEHLERNPRQVKRAINIFTLLWRLSQSGSSLELKSLVKPVRLAKVVVLQQRHEELYTHLRKDPTRLKVWEQQFRDEPDMLAEKDNLRGELRKHEQSLDDAKIALGQTRGLSNENLLLEMRAKGMTREWEQMYPDDNEQSIELINLYLLNNFAGEISGYKNALIDDKSFDVRQLEQEIETLQAQIDRDVLDEVIADHEELDALRALFLMEHPQTGPDATPDVGFAGITEDEARAYIFLASAVEESSKTPRERETERPESMSFGTGYEPGVAEETSAAETTDQSSEMESRYINFGLRLSESAIGEYSERAYSVMESFSALSTPSDEFPEEARAQFFSDIADPGNALFHAALETEPDSDATKAQLGGSSPLIVNIGRREMLLPWEIVIESLDANEEAETAGNNDGEMLTNQSWGFTRIIQRPLVIDQDPAQVPGLRTADDGPELILAVNPKSRQIEAIDDMEKRLWEKPGATISRTSDLEELWKNVRQGIGDIIYIHGRSVKGELAIDLGKDEPFDYRLLEYLQESGRMGKRASRGREPGTALYILDTDLSMGRHAQLEHWLTALYELGAGGVLLPLVAPNLSWSNRFLEQFLNALFVPDTTVGEALLSARKGFLREPGNPLSLFFAFFGDVNQVLLRGEKNGDSQA